MSEARRPPVERSDSTAARRPVPPARRIEADDVACLVSIVDRDGRLVAVNRAIIETTGYAEEELVGRHMWDTVVPPDQADRYKRQYRALRGTELPDGYETWWTTRDGARRLILWTNRAFEGRGATPDLILSTGIDITEQRAREERLEHLAYHDELTGLPNRRLFHEEAGRLVALAGRTRQPGAILLIDLDDLKAVNDGLGHEAGDRLLQHVATCLKGRLRASDLVGRIAGDEFAALLPGITGDRAESVAADLCRAVTARPLPLDRRRVLTTISVGVAMFAGGEPLDEIVRTADEAMYEAKASGGNRVVRLGRATTEVLTRRQLEVLSLAAEGRTTREIATELYLSTATVRNHIAAALRALEAHSRLAAVAAARDRGLL
jgi:diguanylate cyclase (GGDEF)-like protein/PAS domain S-box-containing protein